MKIRRFLVATIVGTGAWLLLPGAARADTVLYDSAGFIQGQQSFVQAFDITTPGTLTVTLSSIPWLDTIAGLNCFLSTATSVLGHPMGVGTESMSVGSGVIYAHWFGNANGAYDLGVYGLKIAFQPGGVSSVPLPTSLILLLSGLAVLLSWQRRKESDAGAETDPKSHTDGEALTI